MVENMGYGPDPLKDIVEKEGEGEQQQEEEEEQEDCFDNPWALRFLPDQFKTEEMCIRALEVAVWQLKDISDHFKMQDMCDDAVWRSLFYLEYIPDWFVTEEQIKILRDDDECCDDHELKNFMLKK